MSNEHGNMLRTITEEPAPKEGQHESREARGPKPLLIKKQQSIDSAENLSIQEESAAPQTNRTQQAEDEDNGPSLEVRKAETIAKIAAPKLNLRTVKNKKQSKQILEMTGGASLLEQTNLTSRVPQQSEKGETSDTYYAEQSSEILSISQHQQKQ